MRTRTVVADALTEVVIVLPTDSPDAPPFQIWVRGIHTRGATRISIWDGEAERPLYVAGNGPTEVGIETY